MNKKISSNQKKQSNKNSLIEKKSAEENISPEKKISQTKKSKITVKKDAVKKRAVKKRIAKKPVTKKILPKSKKINSTKKRLLSKIIDGKPYFLKNQHEEIITKVVKKLEESVCFIMLYSEDKDLSAYYKEVVVDLIKSHFEFQILIFDSSSGPDLLTIINQQIQNSTLEDLGGVSKNESHKYLIIDNENNLSKLDWSLVEIIKKDFKFKKIGALTIRPDKYDVNINASTNSCFEIFEFDSLEDEDIVGHMQYVLNREEESFFLENMKNFNLLKYEITDKENSKHPSLREKIFDRFKFKKND